MRKMAPRPTAGPIEWYVRHSTLLTALINTSKPYVIAPNGTMLCAATFLGALPPPVAHETRDTSVYRRAPGERISLLPDAGPPYPRALKTPPARASGAVNWQRESHFDPEVAVFGNGGTRTTGYFSKTGAAMDCLSLMFAC